MQPLPTDAIAAAPVLIRHLELANYKNHLHGSYAFGDMLTCVTGLNGSGKTNLLDAIYLLALTKSKFQKADADLIAYGEGYFRLAAELVLDGKPHKLTAAYQTGGRKIFKRDGVEVERLADHIGTVPCVFVTPDDTILVKGGAEERRTFFDGLLSQSSPPYLDALLRYNRLLRQRNATLAAFAGRRYYDEALLASYDEPLLALAAELAPARAAAVEELRPYFTNYYAWLSEGRETPGLTYQTQVQDVEFTSLYLASRQADIAAGRTLLGPHRDEYELTMDGYAARKAASQGQHKTFMLSLKLAGADYLAARLGRRPILLLDDIFERLDERRIAGLLRLIGEGRLGQCFISEATGTRLRSEVNKAGLEERAVFIEMGNAV